MSATVGQKRDLISVHMNGIPIYLFVIHFLCVEYALGNLDRVQYLCCFIVSEKNIS